VASVSPHFGEEDCLHGRHGSGTIFFARCNLRCVFCQNGDIRQQTAGTEFAAARIAEEVSPDTFVNIMGQYRPENHMGEMTADGAARFAEINRRPSRDELAEAHWAAREAGLWRFA
jgi:uncharacterized Fe-S radical SAM superfamily protein PflX